MDDALLKEVQMLGARFYRKKLWVVMTWPTGDLASLEPQLIAHLQYQIALEKRGALFAAGPLSPSGDGPPTGEGLIILRAQSEAEAREIADADPMHSTGVRDYSLRQWDVHEGRIGISIDLSDSSFRLE